MKTHFSLLDGLRFFAAFWVMNFHYFLGSSVDLHWYRYGNFGVQIFFIISGFVIVISLKGKTIKEFTKNRIIRLFPLFWIICSGTYLLTLLIPNARPRLFSEYLSSMTMLGDQFNGYAGFGGLIDASYWTLAIELIFYFAIGLFVLLFSYKNIRYFFTIWLGFSFLAILFQIDNNFYIKLGLVHHASYFIFGGALALISIKESKRKFETIFDWCLLFGSALYSTYIIEYIYLPYLGPHHLDILIVKIINILLFIGIALLVSISYKVKKPSHLSFLAILGGITYPLYLLHQTIGNTLINYFTEKFIFSRTFLSIIFEILIIGVAFGIYLYDKKMRICINKILLVRQYSIRKY